jgi:uncharacterized protein DUF4240
VQHFRAMDIERFWDLIERARTAAGPAADQAVRDFDEPGDDPDRDYWDFDDEQFREVLANRDDLIRISSETSADLNAADEAEEDDDLDDIEDEEDVTDPVALALLELLTQLSAAEIAAFDNIFEDVRATAESQDVVNAAVLIEHGFLGDDSFDDFRAGLVALGRTAFERAVAAPDTLADHPLVREIAAAHDPRWLGREDMLFVASHAYAIVTGEDEVTFYDFAEAQRPEPPAPVGDEEVDDYWDVDDEVVARQRLPRLSDLFYERSMRNRQRAMEKLGLQD